MRGEKHMLINVLLLLMGSSPLARGKVEVYNLAEKIVGIIPACAGKRTAVL